MDELFARFDCPPDIPAEVHSRRMFALIPTTIILILSVLTYLLRIYCRRKTGQRIGWDDILMGCGLLISLEPAICEYLLLQNGLGYHICHVPEEQRKRFAVISFALQRANQPALACIKISILLFYLRIFGQNNNFRMATYFNMAYTIGWAISTWIVNLTVCTPIAFYYDRTIKGGTCKNQAISGSVNGGLSLLGDILILILPVPMIWTLKMNSRRKIGICGIFMLGCFTCVASTIRIVELTRFVPTDATYSQVYSSTWTDLEMGVAVISGNLPLLAPVFQRILGKNASAMRYYYYGSGGRDGDGGFASNYHQRSRLHDNSVSRGPTQTFASLESTSYHPERFNDTAQVVSSQDGDMEMDDRAILVKTQVDVISAPVDSESEPQANFEGRHRNKWLQSN